jgi:hypothetical protein
MKIIKYFIILSIFLGQFLFFQYSNAQTFTLGEKLSGMILLQTESHGEAWYVFPTDKKRYSLGRPLDAFNLMKKLGTGAKHSFISSQTIFAEQYRGKIYLDTDEAGQAYYIYPNDGKAYYLGRPDDAFRVMRELGLGITNNNIYKIQIGALDTPCTNCSASDDAAKALRSAGSAVASGNKSDAVKYFVPSMKKSIEYTINHLSRASLQSFGQILVNAVYNSSEGSGTKVYKSSALFPMNGQNINILITLKKQTDGKWLIDSL